MTKIDIPHKAWILVGDGRKALFLVNEGDETFPNFAAFRLMEHENPPTREQGTDKPGRLNGGDGTPRSSVETTDWHQLEEDRFAHDIADALHKAALKGQFEKLVLVAPPKVLGELRKSLHHDVRARITAEIDKTLTNHTVAGIEKLLTKR